MKNSDFLKAVDQFSFNGYHGADALDDVVRGIMNAEDTTADGSYDLDRRHDGLAAFIALLPSN